MRETRFQSIEYHEKADIRLCTRIVHVDGKLSRVNFVVTLGGTVVSSTHDAEVAVGAFNRAVERQLSLASGLGGNRGKRVSG